MSQLQNIASPYYLACRFVTDSIRSASRVPRQKKLTIPRACDSTEFAITENRVQRVQVETTVPVSLKDVLGSS